MQKDDVLQFVLHIGTGLSVKQFMRYSYFVLIIKSMVCTIFIIYTWEFLPYLAVLQSATRTAEAGSSIHTFLRGLKLQTSAVLWSRCQTADLSSSMAALQCCDPGMPQSADLGSFIAALGR